MNRKEFAQSLNIPEDRLPKKLLYKDVSWQMIHDNACPDCKNFNMGGHFPVIHHVGCPQTERGMQEGIARVIAVANERERA